jgi:hypothetical protein
MDKIWIGCGAVRIYTVRAGYWRGTRIGTYNSAWPGLNWKRERQSLVFHCEKEVESQGKWPTVGTFSGCESSDEEEDFVEYETDMRDLLTACWTIPRFLLSAGIGVPQEYWESVLDRILYSRQPSNSNTSEEGIPFEDEDGSD